jgi:hypothetical protein
MINLTPAYSVMINLTPEEQDGRHIEFHVFCGDAFYIISQLILGLET